MFSFRHISEKSHETIGPYLRSCTKFNSRLEKPPVMEKARVIDLFSLKTSQMRTLHLTWLGVFLCFFASLAHSSLLPTTIGPDLGLLIASLFALMNSFARRTGGWFGDQYTATFGLTGRVRWPVATTILFCLCVQIAEGATYSGVPFTKCWSGFLRAILAAIRSAHAGRLLLFWLRGERPRHPWPRCALP
jgi:nitrate/nitrite transporter NarK